MLFANALNIVNITKDLTIFVAESPTAPDMGKISVIRYKAIVTGTSPRGFFRADKISSSTLDSVFAASRPIAFRTVAIIKPLKRKAANKITSDTIISERLTP